MAKRRKAGEGSLSKRKDGRWEARVVVSYDEKGMPKTKNVTAVSKAKCLEKLEKLKVILKKGDLPDIRLHDLRHTFTSHAANSGIAPKTLSEIVGHSKASFTLDHYAHVTSDMQKNAANIVTNYITDILGKELKPWQNAEKQAKER